MKFKSQMVTQVSGSIGGITYAHNRGGMYQRARAIPTDPNTASQAEIRSYFSQLTNLWSQTLTTAQWTAWKVYAQLVPVLDKLGDPIFLTGLQMYVRCNVPRLQAGLARMDDAPTTFTVGDFTLPVLAAPDVSAATMSVAYTATDDWAIADGGGLLVWASMPVENTVEYWRGPYRFAGVVLGNTATPPTSPAVIALPYVPVLDKGIFVRIRASNADGRLTPSVYLKSPASVA